MKHGESNRASDAAERVQDPRTSANRTHEVREAMTSEIPSLRRYARSLCASIDEADDVVQETLKLAVQASDRWRGDGPLRAWLFTILRNEFNRTRRIAQRWRTIDVDEISDAPMAPTSPPTDPFLMKKLADALAELPADQREALVLVSIEGATYAEAAAITGAPIGTIMSRLSRARAKMRAATG